MYNQSMCILTEIFSEFTHYLIWSVNVYIDWKFQPFHITYCLVFLGAFLYTLTDSFLFLFLILVIDWNTHIDWKKFSQFTLCLICNGSDCRLVTCNNIIFITARYRKGASLSTVYSDKSYNELYDILQPNRPAREVIKQNRFQLYSLYVIVF